MTSPSDIIPQKVGKQELYKYFNDPTFRADLMTRTNQQVDVYCDLAPESAGQVPGTTSHVYDWYSYDEQANTTTLLATVHLYKQPDGTVGASGQPDPVFLVVDGVPLVDP
jgi:hypothetical protein